MAIRHYYHGLYWTTELHLRSAQELDGATHRMAVGALLFGESESQLDCAGNKFNFFKTRCPPHL